MQKYLAPSLLSANFYNLETDLKILKENNIRYLHLDVMDGLFVPNISFGIPVIKKINEYMGSDFIFDTHLMIINPEKYISEFRKAGSDIITIHKEATKDVEETIDLIKTENLRAGVAINPETDVKSIEDILYKIDLVLVMSVQPGFGGQKFIDSTVEKVKYLCNEKIKNDYNYIIEIDGGINSKNLKYVFDSGVDIAVAGSAVFNGEIKENLKLLETLLIDY